jgi:hypothetical protein
MGTIDPPTPALVTPATGDGAPPKLFNHEKRQAWLACLQAAAYWRAGAHSPQEHDLTWYADLLYSRWLERCPAPTQ